MNKQAQRAIAKASLVKWDFTKEFEAQIVKYIHDNAEHMHEITADMVTKVAELADLCPNDWEQAADMVVLTHRGRIEKFLWGNDE